MVWAKNWRGQDVTAESLLDRYNMTIDRKPGSLHVVGLKETSGRAQLRNVVLSTEDPVVFLWTWKGRIAEGNPPLAEPTKMEWNDLLADTENTLNCVVTNTSYYWPTSGAEGEHMVTPRDGGDTVRGWGLAQDLPDQPTMGDDNRYQTLIVYWGTDGTNPPPGPIDPGPIDPIPNPDPGTPGNVPPPTGRLYGIHSPKDGISDDDFEKWKRIQPGAITLTPPSMNPETVNRLRRDIPGVFILGRFFGSPEINAWRTPYWDGAAMRRYGVYCRQEAERIGLDACVFSNEPGIDDPVSDGGRGDWWFTKSGYETLASGYRAWAQGFKSITGKCLAGTIPLSPGHHEDDDPNGEGWTGAAILAPVYAELADLFVSHDYYHRGAGSETDQWFGGRLVRKLRAYGWVNKPVVISEWNRDEPDPHGDAERDADVGQSERFLMQYRGIPKFYGATRFIWRSDSYPRLSWHEEGRQLALAERINKQGGSVADPLRQIECQVVFSDVGLAVVGKSFRAVVNVSRKDNGKPVPAGSILTAILNWTRKLVNGVDTAPVPGSVKFYPVDNVGRVVVEFDVPAGVIPTNESTEGATLQGTILGLADLVGYDEQFNGSAVVPIEVLATSPVTPPPGPNPDQPGPTPPVTQTSVWAHLAGIHNRAGDVDNLIAAGKIDEARALNLDQQRTVKALKDLFGFP